MTAGWKRRAVHRVSAAIRRAMRRAAQGGPCLKCGCTETRACPGGCGWSVTHLKKGELVCTSCTVNP